MNMEEYSNFLIKNLPFAQYASGRTEVVCKCFYCPDSGDHHHLYVSIPRIEGEPSKYNCFKCGAHGWVTYRKLIEWGIFDQDMNIQLSEYYRNSVQKGNYLIFANNSEIANLYNDFIREGELSELKLKYINKRLGLNLTYQDLISNKIVLNLGDLLSRNYITNYTRDPRVIESLDQYFLGFISYDNSYVNLKRLVSEGVLYESIDERYINYDIFNKEDNSKKFYLSPVDINIYDPNPIKVHIAEGPFDALSIKYNLRKEVYNNIYIAVAGNQYKGAIMQVINYIKLINLEIHLYIDSDVKQYVIDDFINYIYPYHYSVYVHRNEIGKDMGESIDKIKEIIEKVL